MFGTEGLFDSDQGHAGSCQGNPEGVDALAGEYRREHQRAYEFNRDRQPQGQQLNGVVEGPVHAGEGVW
ncbi:hypothetical protein ACFP6B_01155 [Rothia nasimurium]|uniref:hypothetical protein n=1 Tax=Rothia nasimurium TaxID=85336 RepID=UPI0036239359